MIESHIGIRVNRATTVSAAAVTQKRDTECCWRCNSDHAGSARDTRKPTMMKWPEKCN